MSYNLVDSTTGALTRVSGNISSNIIPANASANNKLVAHQTPYSSFTLNNNSGSQKWYKLGNYGSGHYPARLDFVSARVDGQMFESSVRISGDGNDNNYVSWVGEKGCEISTISVKVDSSRNIYAKMNSYSAVEIRVYGTFTLNITELDSEPSGTDITLQKLVTESDVNPIIDVSTVWDGTNHTLNINILSAKYGLGSYMIYGQGSSGHGCLLLNVWEVISGSFAYSWQKIYNNNVSTNISGGGVVYVSPTLTLESTNMGTVNNIKRISKI